MGEGAAFWDRGRRVTAWRVVAWRVHGGFEIRRAREVYGRSGGVEGWEHETARTADATLYPTEEAATAALGAL